MRFSFAVLGLTALQVSLAQVALPTNLFGLSFSPACQQTVLGVLTNGSFSQCIQASTLIPIFTTNNSIIPSLDQFMSGICYNTPCSNDTLNQAAATIQQGCAADIANSTQLPQGFVQMAFAAYPLVRRVLCLKTSQPYTAESYGGSLGAPPTPITAYNSTGGYFCVSSFLTQLSAYFQTSLSFPFIYSIATGQNTTAVGLVQSIQPNILCNNCLFGFVDVISSAVPAFANVTAQAVFGALGIQAASAIPQGTTLVQAMDATCSYVPLMVSTNGTLPANVTQAATS